MRTLIIVVAFSLTACVSVHPDNSLGVAQTHAALNQRLGLNRVSVPSGTLLRGAMMDGHPAYCTVGPAYFSLADNRAVCLYDSKQSGYFDSYYVLGSLRSAGTFETSVPYTLSTQAQAAPQTGPPSANPLATSEISPSWVDVCVKSATDPSLYPECNRLRGEAEVQSPPVAADPSIPPMSSTWTANQIDVCDPSVTNPYLILECAQRTDQAKAICLQSAGCTPPTQTYEQAQAEAARRSAALAQVQTNQARAIAQTQADYIARQQQLAACTALADITALSINNFWGGLFAGLGVGAVCMQ